VKRLGRPLLKRDLLSIEKTIALLDILKPQLLADEQFAKDQFAKLVHSRRAVTLQEARRIFDLASYRVDKLCDARHSVQALLDSCSPFPNLAGDEDLIHEQVVA
jgi:hypothetical protein